MVLVVVLVVVLSVLLLLFFFAFEPSLSQPDIGMEFLNSPSAPQSRHLPMLVGPLGLSIIHR